VSRTPENYRIGCRTNIGTWINEAAGTVIESKPANLHNESKSFYQ
jgi:hypothetical protein